MRIRRRELLYREGPVGDVLLVKENVMNKRVVHRFTYIGPASVLHGGLSLARTEKRTMPAAFDAVERYAQ